MAIPFEKRNRVSLNLKFVVTANNEGEKLERVRENPKLKHNEPRQNPPIGFADVKGWRSEKNPPSRL